MMNEIIYTVLIESFEVVAAVLVMMIALEYLMIVGVPTKFTHLKSSFGKQFLLALGVGLVPGCMGGYALVSLYSHGTIGFPALLAGFIVTLGDESFILLSLVPKTTLLLWLILGCMALIISYLTYKFLPTKKMKGESHIQIHEHVEHSLVNRWIPSRHFWKEHVWEHVIKKHAPMILLWTASTLIAIHLLGHFFDLKSWVESNLYLVFLAAIVVGIIPISGPHILFIGLFVAHTIPFSVLLANSIVQDGHSGLPLLAEDRRAFVKIKIIKIVFAIITSSSLYYFGY